MSINLTIYLDPMAGTLSGNAREYSSLGITSTVVNVHPRKWAARATSRVVHDKVRRPDSILRVTHEFIVVKGTTNSNFSKNRVISGWWSS